MPNRLDRAIEAHRAALKAIDRAALAETYSAYQDVLDRIEPLIESLQQVVTDQGVESASEVFRLDRYQQLRQQVLTEMETLARATGDATRRAQLAAIQETINAGRVMAIASAPGQGAIQIGNSWVRLPVAAFEDLVGATQSGPLRELLNTLGDATSNAITNELLNGLATGQGPRKIAEALHRAMDIPRNRALTIARTETFRAQRGAAQRLFEANDDILKGWYWTAAHQTRTCAACLALDGQLFPTSEKLRGHPNCRCAMRPALRDLPERRVESGEEWLRGQPPGEQDKVLGQKGGAAWRAGDVELADFVRIDESEEWGPSTRDGGIGWARVNAMKRGVPQTTMPSPRPRRRATTPDPSQAAPERAPEPIRTPTIPKAPHRLAGTAPDAVLEVEDAIITDTTESGHAFRADGTRLFTKTGDATSVTFSDGERRQLKDAILTHNHPSGSAIGDSGFSENDLTFAVNVDLAEMRAVTSTGKRYSLKRPPDGWGADVDTVRTAYAEATIDVMATYRAEFRAGRLTQREAEARVQSDITKKVAERFGWDHSETE